MPGFLASSQFDSIHRIDIFQWNSLDFLARAGRNTFRTDTIVHHDVVVGDIVIVHDGGSIVDAPSLIPTEAMTPHMVVGKIVA